VSPQALPRDHDMRDPDLADSFVLMGMPSRYSRFGRFILRHWTRHARRRRSHFRLRRKSHFILAHLFDAHVEFGTDPALMRPPAQTAEGPVLLPPPVSMTSQF
jgi:hypothetical protein